MSKSLFVNFKAIKAAITMERVLEHYGLLQKFKKKGDSLSGPCPIHKGDNPTQFRVSISKNIWNCFSECKHGGNVLDFIAQMENGSVHGAALKAIEWFHLDPDVMSGKSGSGDDTESERADTKPKTEPKQKKAEQRQEDTTGPNKPLKFRLEKLERSHPYLADRGVSVETLVDFGAGYCAKGMMAGRIAIPIHNVNGEVVAYAGRLTNGEPSDENPKYKLPPGFKKSLELFNIDRAGKESPDEPLVVVEGFFDCMKLHQVGHRKTVALMGSSMSPAQEELIREHTHANSRVILMLDEDEAGQAGREDISARLSRFCFVKAHVFPTSGMQPEDLSAEELQEIVGGAV
ncbi:MAG TPA: toprim domain-containing protein [Candidatus Angelobacter sp.]|nr:toprim domain-containing protein [Candidatus Angelobacter sp.]